MGKQGIYLMASRNLLALQQGRITQDQYDSMAAAKFTYHGNFEDLDVNNDYSMYGVTKWYPVVGFGTHDDRPIVSIRGFVKYMMDKLGVTDYDLDDIVNQNWWQQHHPDSCISFTYRSLGWTWCRDHDCHSTKIDDVIYYTFGGCFGGKPDPLADYVDDITELYE